MARRKGLGRGLDALLGDAGTSHAGGLRELPLDLLQRGRFQPRVHIDDKRIAELAASIRVRGVVQPVVVRTLEGGNGYELIAGERRWRAAQLAGLTTIPALVRDADDEEAAALALIENIQREDLNSIEEARALRRLTVEFGLTHQQVADAVGRSRTAVSNLLRLLELTPEVREQLEQGLIEMGHARALLALEATAQRDAAAAVVSRGLSVRETEQLVRRALDGDREPKPAPPVKANDPNVRRLEMELADRIGASVTIRQRSRGRGALVISYNSLDELDGILARIR